MKRIYGTNKKETRAIYITRVSIKTEMIINSGSSQA